jgi:hemerythrin-like domain-containing protein
MSDPIEVLMEEHKEVLATVNSITNLQKELKDSPGETVPKLKELIERLDKDFDIHSLNKEEKALFPAMESFIPRDEGPIGIMIQEHIELVKRIHDFKEALGVGNYDKVIEASSYITSVIPDHIYKEDNILYNMARMHLTSEDMDGIYKKMLEFEKESPDHPTHQHPSTFN